MAVREVVAEVMGGTRSEGRDTPGTVDRFEERTLGMGRGAMPGRFKGGKGARGARDDRPADTNT